MQTKHASLRGLLLVGGVILAAFGSAASAAEVTYERLVNADKEPQNWLMVHRTYDSQRFSPLNQITKQNVKNLRLLFAVAIGGSTGNESVEATPLVEDAISCTSSTTGASSTRSTYARGTAGRIVWKMIPARKRRPQSRRDVVGNLVLSVALDGRVIATDKETGKIVWDRNLHRSARSRAHRAPLALKDTTSSAPLAATAAYATGSRRSIPRPAIRSGKPIPFRRRANPAAKPEGQEQRLVTGGGAFYVTGSYDPATNLTYWGSGNPVPGYDASYRPGDNLYTASALAFNAGTGKIAWHFQYTPNDNHDYDETGTHILIDAKVNGEDRKIVSHAGRNGFNYVFDRNSGQFLNAAQYTKVT